MNVSGLFGYKTHYIQTANIEILLDFVLFFLFLPAEFGETVDFFREFWARFFVEEEEDFGATERKNKMKKKEGKNNF